MPRVEKDDTFSRNSAPRQQKEEQRRDQPGVGHTPSKAEGDERDIDEALISAGEVSRDKVERQKRE